jgi:uncharacterized membrane protein
MNTQHILSSLALALFAGSAAAQAPIFIELGPNTAATDVTVVGNQVIVAGRLGSQVARWTMSTGLVPLGQLIVGGNIRISADGNKIATTITGPAFDQAAYWDGAWHTVPGLGAQSGTSESTGYDISGDGQTIVGSAWVTPGAGHCFSWSSATGSVDHGGPFSDPSSRANAVNGDGSVIVGMKDLLNGTRQGARWVNGVMNHLNYVNPSMVSFPLGEAYGVNTSGSTIVGYRVYGGPSSAWRWDAATSAATLLPNLPGETLTPVAVDVSDDGATIVGHSGGNAISGTRAVVWVNNQPQSLFTMLSSMGTQGLGSYTELGFANAVSNDGNVIVGSGSGFAGPQPPGGWIVILPGAQQIGTTFCSGDGTATACPCGNVGGAGRGCASSVEPTGARLVASGTASLTGDTVVLHGTGMPNSSALYFQGTSQQGGGLGAVFGDGLRCAGGSVVRLKTVTNASGASDYPTVTDPSVSVKGMIVAPGVRTYQVWYRNAAAFCTISTFNLTNGVSITWGT